MSFRNYLKIKNWKLKIARMAHWCWATLPRKIISSLVILAILGSSIYFLFKPTPAEAGIPVLWLKFDEGYGTVAYDMTDNGNDFTLSEESWTGYGKFSRAWYGDGAKWVSRVNDPDFDFAAADILAYLCGLKAVLLTILRLKSF